MKILDLYNTATELKNNPPHGLMINFEIVEERVSEP